MLNPLRPASVPRLARAQGLRLEARQVLDGLYAGGHRTAWHGSSLDFAEHRAYQPGDDPRAIDWKAFARTDRMLIRRWHDDRQLPVALLLDTSASLDYGVPAKRNRAALAAAILGLLASDQGDSVRVCPGANQARWSGPFAGPGSDGRICAAISEAEVQRSTPAEALDAANTALTRRTLVILVSDLLQSAGALIEAAARCTGRGHALAVIHILDRSEVELPAQWGRVLLTDPEEGHPAVACEAGEAKAAFDAAMAAHQLELRQGLSACRAGMVRLISDENPVAILGPWLMRGLAA